MIMKRTCNPETRGCEPAARVVGAPVPDNKAEVQLSDRERLLSRLKEVDAALERALKIALQPARSLSEVPLREERAALEAALAQHDATDALREGTRAQLANTEAIQAATAERERARAQQDDAAFWFRRYFTTVGVGNAALFAALISGVLQAQDVYATGALMHAGLERSGIGSGLALVIPGILYLRGIVAERWKIWLLLAAFTCVTTSTGCFTFALKSVADSFKHANYATPAAAPPLGTPERCQPGATAACPLQVRPTAAVTEEQAGAGGGKTALASPTSAR